MWICKECGSEVAVFECEIKRNQYRMNKEKELIEKIKDG